MTAYIGESVVRTENAYEQFSRRFEKKHTDSSLAPEYDRFLEAIKNNESGDSLRDAQNSFYASLDQKVTDVEQTFESLRQPLDVWNQETFNEACMNAKSAMRQLEEIRIGLGNDWDWLTEQKSQIVQALHYGNEGHWRKQDTAQTGSQSAKRSWWRMWPF